MAFTLIIGPMKSGKSLELIARVAPYEFAEQKVLYVQSANNTRDDGIVSRAGVNTSAIKVHSLAEVDDDFHIIGIDEINMFPPSDVQFVAKWLKADKGVFISGLDLDYRGHMPPVVQALFELKPESIITKIAVCEVCHRYAAQFTQIVHKDEPVLGGLPLIVPEDGTYEYQARCRTCFVQASTT